MTVVVPTAEEFALLVGRVTRLEAGTPVPVPPGPAVPPAIAGLKYSLKFQEDFDKPIDLSPNGLGSYKWYWNLWYENQIAFPNRISYNNSVARLSVGVPGQGFQLCTLSKDGSSGASFDSSVYFEGRIRYDANNPKNWGALWLFDKVHASGLDNDHWSEIDGMEVFDPHAFVGTNHEWGPGGSGVHKQNGNNWFSMPSIDFTQFHTFGCHVDRARKKISWYLDDKIVMDSIYPYDINFTRPHFLILGLEEHTGGVTPTWMEVDWVKVWVL